MSSATTTMTRTEYIADPTTNKDWKAEPLKTKENGGYYLYDDIEMKPAVNSKPYGYSHRYESDGSHTSESGSQYSKHSKEPGYVSKFQTASLNLVSAYSSSLVNAILFVLFVGFTVYLVFAIKNSVDQAQALIILTGIAVFCVGYTWVKHQWGDVIYRKVLRPIESFFQKYWSTLQW